MFVTVLVTFLKVSVMPLETVLVTFVTALIAAVTGLPRTFIERLFDGFGGDKMLVIAVAGISGIGTAPVEKNEKIPNNINIIVKPIRTAGA